MRMCVLGMALLLGACTGHQQPAKDDSLYQALGGKPGISRIVEGMLLNVARDERIVAHFRNVNIELLRVQLIDKFCVEAGGPCKYTGDDMVEAHKGQQISRSEFNALVEDLIKAMEAQGVPVPAQNRLLARLAAQRGEVIEK
ncbi:group 1 truncated hemoglobin [Pseudomonas sp. CFBP 8770]|jgi:hemoglobin|uniref:group I truncated hemoglobin n=1 Tax=unclassified Pseudomonas TaxID=196821 RepID=UPI001785D732|nr:MULTISPECIES: group 1 truncated hemoglobin [unclassified Pseudomonas]MBD8476273.1 group 1 truncated hemoglobin [Pseudomonas sp. CFBP 8773]MBD8649055.1 group 1 truncated hemoglobin [Pseudomonas sp. CFBP 8770]MBD8685271.1 group 1 truncated hemoglobin [Pseudomonas sp. CFBP 13719]